MEGKMENTTIKKFKIERTRTGLPARWECGGSATNTGECTIIAGANGLPKKAVYIKRSGHLSNGRHALIIVEVGDYIIEAYHHRKDFTIRIHKILQFDDEAAIVEQINRFSKNEWDAELPAFLEAAVEAAKDKATCYHCRSAHYIAE